MLYGHGLSAYLLVVAVVFAVNLLPAFGPPTWAVLVFLRLQSDLAAVPLILLGAAAAAAGRLVLASAARSLRGHLSPRHRANLQAASDALVRRRSHALAGLGLFALSPVPSAQLFIAAGVLSVPLLGLTAAFFAGRLVSYSIYVGAAGAARHSFGSVLTNGLTSPAGIALQVLMLAALVAIVRIDWAKLLARRSARDA